MYDIIIIGGGPSGLTAAVYGRRAGKSVLVIEKETFGGQINFSPKVENIPGFVSVSGSGFAEKLTEQAISQGAEFEIDTVTGIEGEGPFTVRTEDGSYEGRSVIIAAGTKHRLMGLPREEDFIGNGISFCAVCDGAFYAGEDVGVVGGGNSALQEAVLLAKTSRHVTIFQDLDRLTGEAELVKQLEEAPNVTILTGMKVVSLEGGDVLTGITASCRGGEPVSYPLAGLFVAIGLIPQNEAFGNIIALDERGYAASGEDCATKVPGIFVAGDCRAKSIRQVATAASDGAAAAMGCVRYLDR